MIARATLATLVAVTAALPSLAAAQSDGRFSADVSASVGYSNNPFAITGDDTGSALASLDVVPRYQILTERSTLTIMGAANVQQYLRDYGRNESYAAALDYQVRPSERFSVHSRLDFSSSVLGATNAYLPLTSASLTGTAAPGNSATGTGTASAGTVVTNPTVPIISPTLTDIGLFGLRNRRSTGRASGDVSIGLTARDSLTVSAYAEATRYAGGAQFGDFEGYSASLGYSRRVSDRVNIGVRASSSLFNYDAGQGDSRVFPVEATLVARLSPLWTLDAALGATIVDSSTVGSTRSTSVSGSANLCRRGELSFMCAQLARQVSPTGLVGTQYVTSAGLNWSRQLSERESVSLGASYSRVGGDEVRLATGGVPLQNEFIQAVAGYNRRLGQRLRLVASLNYRQLLGDTGNRPKDFGGLVGLSYRIGDPR